MVTLVLLGAWETFWRQRGGQPSVQSLQPAWNIARARVQPRSLVMVGASKIQSALEPQILGSALGREPALQLSIIGTSPVAVIEELASDERFRGILVVDIVPRILFDQGEGRPERLKSILAGYREYRTSPAQWFDAPMDVAVEGGLILRRSALTIDRVIARLVQRRLPNLQPIRVRRDRFMARSLDTNQARLRHRQEVTRTRKRGTPLTSEELALLIDRVSVAADRIESRGGRVVLTLLPRSPRIRVLEERRFPSSIYWDVLQHQTGLAAIDSEKDPALRSFRAADGTHLNADQAASFTRLFAARLEALVADR